MKSITFERKSLYNDVWTTPLSHLAKQNQITHYQLLKACKELNVPVPKMGHWQKVKFGKKVDQVPLPAESNKESYTIVTGLPKNSIKKSISAPLKLTNPHPLVAATHKYFNENDPYPRNGRMSPNRSDLLDIVVTKKTLKRALIISDAIIKNAIKMGFGIARGRMYHNNRTYFLIGEEKVFFRIIEVGRKKKDKLFSPNHPEWGYSYELEFIGDLKVICSISEWLYDPRIISDTKNQKLEDRLDRVFLVLSEMAEKAKIERLKMQEYHQKRDREREIRIRIKQDKEAELKKREMLELLSEKFNKAQYIYQFIAEINSKREQLDLDEEKSAKFERWLTWANEHAERLDPMNQAFEAIFENQEIMKGELHS